MTIAGWILILVFTALFVGLAKPMGSALFAMYGDKRLPLAGLENGFYKLAGVDPKVEQSWVGYAPRPRPSCSPATLLSMASAGLSRRSSGSN